MHTLYSQEAEAHAGDEGMRKNLATSNESEMNRFLHLENHNFALERSSLTVSTFSV